MLHVVLLPRVCTTSGSTKAEAARRCESERVWWSKYNFKVHRCSRRQAETVLKIAGFRMLVTHLRRLTTRTTLPSGRLK